jgi:hypothetical protein
MNIISIPSMKLHKLLLLCLSESHTMRVAESFTLPIREIRKTIKDDIHYEPICKVTPLERA